MAGETIIGIDVGTTTVKALMIAADGRLIDKFAESYPTTRRSGGVVEQDPDTWVALILKALGHFAGRADLSGLRAIGICSQVNTHVFVADDGRPLMPALVWQDGRCATEAEALDGRISDGERIAWWGAPMPIDASHALSRMAWTGRHHPEIWSRTRFVLLPKDYCILRLTGVAVSDPISAIGLVGTDLAYVRPLLDLVPGAEHRLPPLLGFSQRAGVISAGLPCAGVPVVTGTMDAWAGMFGVGVSSAGAAMYLSGTSEILGLISPARVPTPGVVVFPDYEGVTLHAGPTQSGGASIMWLSGLLGQDLAALSQLAASGAEAPPLFLPHLQGERAPLWDIQARGIFLGLEAGHGAPHLARAVMEGVAYSARLALEAVERSAGRSAESLNCGGGGFQSDIWNQIRADVLGRPLRRIAVADVGALGAAALAAVGGGVHRTLEEALGQIVRFDRNYEPDLSRSDDHAAMFALFGESYAATKAISHKLASRN